MIMSLLVTYVKYLINHNMKFFLKKDSEEVKKLAQTYIHIVIVIGKKSKQREGTYKVKFGVQEWVVVVPPTGGGCCWSWR
jgi:hypothetical protein